MIFAFMTLIFGVNSRTIPVWGLRRNVTFVTSWCSRQSKPVFGDIAGVNVHSKTWEFSHCSTKLLPKAGSDAVL
jgi:hypothetical protein